MGRNHKSLGRLIAVGAFVAALCSPLSAQAQSKEDRHRALEHFKQGEAYMKAKAYDRAVQEYEAAYAAVPKAGFLFNIGLAYQSAGDAKKALDYYQRYLKLEPKGRASREARARAAALEHEIRAEEAAEAEAARKKLEAEERKRAARAHADAAAEHRGAGQYEKALTELRAAYDADPDPEYVFQIAEIYRLRGDRPRAIVEYERYRALAPTGANSPAAIGKITELKTEIEEASRPKPQPLPAVEIRPPPPEVKKKKQKGGLDWKWLAIGAAAVVAGVGMDLGPDNSRNGDLDGTDFVPVGLYGVGGVFLLMGVF